MQGEISSEVGHEPARRRPLRMATAVGVAQFAQMRMGSASA